MASHTARMSAQRTCSAVCATTSSVAPAAVLRRPLRRRLCVARGGSSDDMPAVMTLEKAYTVLGVEPSAPFEKVIEQKTRKAKHAERDAERLMLIETAYDLLFMQHMRKRLTGELEVSTSVRYADVPAAPPKRTSAAALGARGGSSGGGASSGGPPATLRASLPSTASLGIAIQAPKNQSLLTTQAVGFSALLFWATIQALTETPDAQLSETAGTQLALALALGIWSLTQKKMPLGKAVGCTMACLVGGALVGSAISTWLRVDIVPLGSFSSPGTLVAECIIAACAAGAIFLI